LITKPLLRAQIHALCKQILYWSQLSNSNLNWFQCLRIILGGLIESVRSCVRPKIQCILFFFCLFVSSLLF
jgi:hypothetical protein